MAPKIETVKAVQAQPTVADPNRPIFFKLDMSMKLLKFNLIKEKSTFLMSSLNNSALNVSVMDDGQVKVGGHLGQIEIKREGRKILMTEGDKVASVLLEMYAKTASYYPVSCYPQQTFNFWHGVIGLRHVDWRPACIAERHLLLGSNWRNSHVLLWLRSNARYFEAKCVHYHLKRCQ